MAVMVVTSFDEEIVCCQNCGWWDNRDDMNPAEVSAWHNTVNGESCRDYVRSIVITTATGLEWNVHGGDRCLPDGRRYLGRWYASSPEVWSSTWAYLLGQVIETFEAQADQMIEELSKGRHGRPAEVRWVMPPRWQRTWRHMIRDTCRDRGLYVRTAYRSESLLACEVKAESDGRRRP